jgi:hypothetical protein
VEVVRIRRLIRRVIEWNVAGDHAHVVPELMELNHHLFMIERQIEKCRAGHGKITGKD